MPVPYANNRKLAVLFRSIAELLAARRDNPYRVRAYRRAADSLEALDGDVTDLAKRHALEEIDGVGKDLAEKILEFLRTGRIQTYETLKAPLPPEVTTWTTLPGLSESLVSYLYRRLNIRTLEDLERLVRSHMLRTMPGFAASEEQLLLAIARLRTESPIP